MSDMPPLSQKVGLDIAEYKAAVAEINRTLRVVESGFRANAAAIGDWAGSASGLELRIGTLTQKIDLQSQKVANLRAIYEQVAAEKGATSAAAQELEIKLNKETESLNAMETELTRSQEALTEMGSASEDAGDGAETYADAADQAAESSGGLGDVLEGLKTQLGDLKGDFLELGNKVLAGVKTGLLALAGAATGAAVGISALVLNAAESADSLVEMSDKTGLSTTQLQEFAYIAEQTGTGLETVTGSLSKLVRSMSSAEAGTGAARDAFSALGVSVTDADGNLRDSQAVFGDVIDALGSVGNETERDALAMAIFGKSAQELNPLIDAGSEGIAAMATEAGNLGAVMGEDTVNSLAAFNDMVAGLKLGFQGFIGQLAGAFLPLFQTVVTAIQGFVSSPEVQAGIQNMITGISGFVSTLAEAVAALLAGDVQGALLTLFPAEVVTQITTIATAFGEFVATMVEFVTTHAEGIKAAFIAIGAVLAAAGIAAALTAIINPISLIIAAVGLLAAAWAEDWGGIRSTLTDWWEGDGQAIFNALRDWLEVAIPAALAVLADFWTNTLHPAIVAVWEWMDGTLFPLLEDLAGWYLGTYIPAALAVLSDIWTNVLLPAIQAVWSWIDGTLFPLLSDLWDWLEVTIPAALETLSGFWTDTLKPALEIVWGFLNDSVIPLLSDLWDLLETGLGVALNAFALIWSNTLYPAVSDFWTLIKETVKPGLDLLEAFWTNTLLPAFSDVDFLTALSTAFDGLANAIKFVRDMIQAVITKLIQMGDNIPEWAIPGSPMPLDYAFRDLGSTLDDVANRRIANLNRAVAGMQGPGVGAVGGGAPSEAGTPAVTNVYNLTENYSPRETLDVRTLFRLMELSSI